MLAAALALAAATGVRAELDAGGRRSALGKRSPTTSICEPSDTRQSDWVTELTPSLHVTEKGARTSLDGHAFGPDRLLRARRRQQYRATRRWICAATSGCSAISSTSRGRSTIAQQFFNPFGAQPLGFENVTQNRYRTSTYRVSPYIKGITPGRISYELRNDNVWTDLSGAPIATSNFRYTTVNAKVSDTESVYRMAGGRRLHRHRLLQRRQHDPYRARARHRCLCPGPAVAAVRKGRLRGQPFSAARRAQRDLWRGL